LNGAFNSVAAALKFRHVMRPTKPRAAIQAVKFDRPAINENGFGAQQHGGSVSVWL